MVEAARAEAKRLLETDETPSRYPLLIAIPTSRKKEEIRFEKSKNTVLSGGVPFHWSRYSVLTYYHTCHETAQTVRSGRFLLLCPARCLHGTRLVMINYSKSEQCVKPHMWILKLAFVQPARELESPGHRMTSLVPHHATGLCANIAKKQLFTTGTILTS